ncbi:MAG: C80 family cysteine peptidase, partial [Desulfovibrionales bacterium]|nr:C80 family cysteine peptidase [Desulfovibrionales bacterium]
MKILGLVTEPGITEAPTSLMVEMVRAVHQVHPSASIRMVPGTTDLAEHALGLGFVANPKAPLFDNPHACGISSQEALANLHTLQIRYMSHGLSRMDSLVDKLTPSQGREFRNALDALKERWNDFWTAESFGEEGRDAVYYELRRQMGELASRMAGKGALSSGETAFLDMIFRTMAQGSTTDMGAAYVEEDSPLAVVQLEGDEVSARSAQFLARRYGDRAVLYQLDEAGNLVSEDGRAAALTSESKIFLVGHGRPDGVAGRSPGELVTLLEEGGLITSGMELRRISVVACATDRVETAVEEGAPKSAFGEELIRAAAGRGVVVNSVTTRTDLVMVDGAGHKWVGTPDADGEVTWTRNGSGTKLLVTRMGENEFVSRRVPVGLGLVEVRTGTRDQGLGPGSQRVVRFLNGRQVGENGLPLPADQCLSPGERGTVERIMGQNPTGTLVLERGRMSILSRENPLTAPVDPVADRARRASAMVDRLANGSVSADDFAEKFRTRTSSRSREAVCNELLHRYGDHPGSTPLGEAVGQLQAEIQNYFDAGRLDSRARLVTQVLLENHRLRTVGEIDTGAERSMNELLLRPERARLAIESVPARSP